MTGRKGRSDSTCHPGRPMKAHGLCKPCYKAKWRRDNPELASAEARRWKVRYMATARNRKNKRLRDLYGIGISEYEQMLAAQGGKCAICREAPATDVDHCHVTGRVRDLLCSRCNAGIGQFNDNIVVMSHAIRYLERHTAA